MVFINNINNMDFIGIFMLCQHFLKKKNFEFSLDRLSLLSFFLVLPSIHFKPYKQTVTYFNGRHEYMM